MGVAPPAPHSVLPIPGPPMQEISSGSIMAPPVQSTPPPLAATPAAPVPNEIVYSPMPEGDLTITTVYVSLIPEGIGDNWMKRILACCGTVCGWKRLSDAKGLPLSFGFCIYEKIEGVALALKVLHGSIDHDDPSSNGIEIHGPISKKRKSLKLNIDKVSRDALEAYLKETDSDRFEQEFKTAGDNVQKVLDELEESLHNGTHRAVDLLLNSAVADSEMMNARQLAAPAWDALEDTSEEISAERKEQIMQEIVVFRQKAAKQLGESYREFDEVSDRKYSADSHKHHEVAKKRHEPPPREHIHHYNPREELDEEEIKLKRRKRLQEQHQCYLERLAHWKKEEASRIGFVKHSEMKEEEDSELLSSHCKTLKESLPGWNQDSKCTNLADRYAYWSKCYRKRLPEILQDEDKNKLGVVEEHPPISAQKKQEAEALEEDEEGGTVLGKIMTREERLSACQKLRDTLPKDKKGLSEWDIKWDELDEYIMEKIVRPFLIEKICELIGSNDTKDLVQFAIELVQNHTPLDKMIDDLQIILDEDAEDTAISLFSIIIYETEAKLRGLT